jgi:aldose 1-epimerase
MTSQRVLELSNSVLRLRFVPEIGATVTDFSARLDGTWVALMRRAAEPLDRASNGASFTVAPFSNRLRNGAFSFEGRTYQLRGAEKHAIHGDVRDRPWLVAHASESAAELAFDSATFADVNFPFPFACRIRYVIDGPTLRTDLTLTNRGDAPMPAGGGFHPYFNRALSAKGDAVELQAAVQGVYPTGDLPLPTGPPVAVPAEIDFSRMRRFDQVLDHCFSGWDGCAVLHWPESRVRLVMRASDSIRHLILYSPGGQPFFAVEPVVNANDGFNLMATGYTGSGAVVLQPGQSLNAGYSLTLEAGAPA